MKTYAVTWKWATQYNYQERTYGSVRVSFVSAATPEQAEQMVRSDQLARIAILSVREVTE